MALNTDMSEFSGLMGDTIPVVKKKKKIEREDVKRFSTLQLNSVNRGQNDISTASGHRT